MLETLDALPLDGEAVWCKTRTNVNPLNGAAYKFQWEFWDHPIPYFFTAGMVAAQDYSQLGLTLDIEHPGEAPRQDFYNAPELGFDMECSASYERPALSESKNVHIIDVTKQLYMQNPSHARIHSSLLLAQTFEGN